MLACLLVPEDALDIVDPSIDRSSGIDMLSNVTPPPPELMPEGLPKRTLSMPSGDRSRSGYSTEASNVPS